MSDFHIQNLSVFDRRRGMHVLRDVNLEVPQGRCIALIGESGSGKSSLALASVQLLEDPMLALETGSVYFGDQDLLALAPFELQQLRGSEIGLVFQQSSSALNPSARVVDLVREGARRRASGYVATREAALEALRRVGLPTDRRSLGRYPHELPAGARQRLLLAVYLAAQPSLLIADEPTAALDTTTQAQVLDLLSRLRRELGFSLWLISHDLAVVAEMAEVIYVMYAGQIVEVAEALDLFERPAHPYTRGLLASIPPEFPAGPPERRRLNVIPGPPQLVANHGCRFRPRCAYYAVRRDALCEQADPTLRPILSSSHARCHFSEELLGE